MPLESNKYFSGIPVNSNFSVVHVPTNVFDGGENFSTIKLFNVESQTLVFFRKLEKQVRNYGRESRCG
jgi:hypothetical protein